MRSLTLFAFACLAFGAVAAENKVVCYLGTWATGRANGGAFQPQDIDANLCTHVIYSFVGLDEKTNKVKHIDPGMDLPAPEGKNGIADFNNLRKKNPKLKTLIAIGGWTDSQDAKYSKMASNSSARAIFVKSVVEFVEKYKFDGFDVDWEYPNMNQNKPDEIKHFTKLLKELRAALPKGSLLTAAVGPAISRASTSYNIPEISKQLDFINLMTYDLHGSWDRKTGLHSALYSINGDKLNVDTIIKYWVKKGAPKEKLILGVPAYGRTFKLVNPSNTAVGAPATDKANAGSASNESGFLAYYEICEKTESGEFTKKFDEAGRVPFAYGGDQWVSYDDPSSIQEKAEYIKKMGLGGAMIWSVENDDFRGICDSGKFPILTTLNHVLRNGKPITISKSTVSKYVPVEPRPVTQKVGNRFSGDEPTESDLECTSSGRLLADPNNKNGYIACSPVDDGQFRQEPMQCPANLEFNVILQACDWPPKQ